MSMLLIAALFLFLFSPSAHALCRNDDGETMESGARYNARGYMLLCVNGMEDVLGCVTADGTEIPLDESDIKDGVERRCFKRWGSYFLDEKQCGKNCGQPKKAEPRFLPGTAKGASVGGISIFDPKDKDALVEQTFVSKESKESSVEKLKSSELPPGARIPSGGNPKFQKQEKKATGTGTIEELAQETDDVEESTESDKSLEKESEKTLEKEDEESGEDSKTVESSEKPENGINEEDPESEEISNSTTGATTKKFPHGPGITPSIKKDATNESEGADSDTTRSPATEETNPSGSEETSDAPDSTQTSTELTEDIAEILRSGFVDAEAVIENAIDELELKNDVHLDNETKDVNETLEFTVSDSVNVTTNDDSLNATINKDVQGNVNTTSVNGTVENGTDPESTETVIVFGGESAEQKDADPISTVNEKEENISNETKKTDETESSKEETSSEEPDPDLIVCKHKDGRRFYKKEEWLENGFRYQCQSNGQYRVIACASPNAGAEVPLGHALTVNGWHLNCTTIQGRTFLEERFIGRGASGATSTSLVGVNSEVNLDVNNNVKCVDDEGSVHNFGEEWSTEKFKFKCEKAGPIAMACLTRSGEEIPVNSTMTEGEKTMSCQVIGDSLIFKETPLLPARNETSAEEFCDVDDEIHAVGDDWSTDQFTFTCKEGGFYQITGCVAPDGTEIEMNTNLTAKGVAHRCYLDGFLAKYEGIPIQPQGCVQAGNEYEVGKSWTHGGFKYECLEGPELTIIACLTDNEKEVNVGEVKELDGLLHSCSRVDNKYFYKADLIDKSEILSSAEADKEKSEEKEE